MRNPAGFLAILIGSVLAVSCVTNSPGVGPTVRAGASFDEEIQYFVRRPVQDKDFSFEAVSDLSIVVRRLGKPNKTTEQDTPNKYESGVVDKVVTFEYSSFVVRYYFASLKRVYFPYSIRFLSNEKIDRNFRLVGTAVEDFMRKISPRKADVVREGQVVFVSKDGANQVSILFDGGGKIESVLIFPYLD